MSAKKASACGLLLVLLVLLAVPAALANVNLSTTTTAGPGQACSVFTSTGGGLSCSMPSGAQARAPISGFAVTGILGGPAVNLVITITGVRSGILQYTFTLNASHPRDEVIVTFPIPLESSVAGGTITVSMPNVGSGNLVALNLHGTVY